MWEPVGPLPASVYWKRRWVAAAAIAAATIMASTLVAVLVASGATQPDETASIRGPERAALTAAEHVSPAPGPGPPGQAVPGPGPPAAEAPAPGPAAGAGDLLADPAGEPAPSPVPQAQTTQAEPVPCTNPMIAVGAEVDHPEHRLGQRVVLRLVVTNVGDRPCVRDLDSARAEIVVWSGDGATRLWSSNDCARGTGAADLRTLEPDQPVAFPVTWAGRTSAPGCPSPGVDVPPGAYRLLSRVDDVLSAPTAFLRSP